MEVSHAVTPSQLRELLVKFIAARRPVLVKGAPGVGKTDIVTAATAAAGCDLLVSHPVTADPTDAKGLPWKVEGANEATFLPFGDLALALAAKRPLVWFLDDLGQATPAVQASFMQLILARRVNGHALPDCVTFVAATNRRADRAGVSGVLEPVKSRFATIVELVTTVDDWTAWAVEHDVAPEVIAFLRLRPELLHKFEPTQDIVNSPCPRTWKHVSDAYKLGLSRSLQLPVFAGAVGDGAAAEFVAFLRIYEDAPNPDLILMDPENAPIPSADNTSALYAVATALAYRATAKNFGAIAIYATRLYRAGHGEFSTLLLKDAVRRDPKITTTVDFHRLATTEVAKAIFEARTLEV